MAIRTIRHVFILVAGIFSGCYYDVEDELYPSTGVSNCDTSNVTYSKDVVPVLSASCLSCHSGSATSGGGIALDSYNAVNAQVSNGKLMGSINYAEGFSPMPKNGAKLSDCTILKIQVWVNNGALNN